MGFLKALEAATATVGADNMIEPKAAKELLDANSDALLLDVQDPGSDSIPGAYNASLGTLVFKASQDLADFKGEPAERPSSAPTTPPAHRVHTTCAPCRQPTGAPAAADPKIADRAKDKLIVVTCALGGQAKLGAKVLVEYGFTNVKVVEGGCVAWKGAGL